ncbi:MAG: chromate transporter [Spirochaetaceae bacterium]|jgi:chromate transporter|nr:chromate transporter [Spirochaetaceae bacterium]
MCRSLFFTFVRIGLISFGGGYSILPIIERELVNGKGWLTIEEMMEYYTIGQITPGIISVNLATFVGYKHKKIFGGLCATAGFILPGVTLITAAAFFIQNFSDIPVVRNIFAGLRLAVGAMILQTIVKLIAGLVQKRRGVRQNAIAVAICAVSFILSLLWRVNPALLVIAAGLTGFLCFRTAGGAE